MFIVEDPPVEVKRVWVMFIVKDPPVEVKRVWVILCSFTESTQGLLRKDMDVNEHERLSNITLRLVQRDTAFIAVLHFIVTGGSSTINITHTLFTSTGGSSTINSGVPLH
jgi:hypothetical protein